MAVMPEDNIIRASAVEHELKSAFISTPSRLVRMNMDDKAKTLSFVISFQKDEVFLKKIFCDCLFSHGLKYVKADQGILLSENKYFTSFLNGLSATAKDFENQIVAMKERSLKTLSGNTNGFFSSPVASTSQINTSPKAGG